MLYCCVNQKPPPDLHVPQPTTLRLHQWPLSSLYQEFKITQNIPHWLVIQCRYLFITAINDHEIRMFCKRICNSPFDNYHNISGGPKKVAQLLVGHILKTARKNSTKLHTIFFQHASITYRIFKANGQQM